MTGGSGVLPPVEFTGSDPIPVLVAWTPDEWVKVFSALMTGADLSYPEQAHEVVWSLLKFVEYPMSIEQPGMVSAFDIWARLMASNGAAWTSTDTTFMFFSHCMMSPLPHNVTNRTLSKIVYFTPGDYEATILYPKTTSSGISDLTISIPGSGIVDTIISVDQNGLFNAEFIASGEFTITEAAYYNLVFGNAGATNSGSYQAGLSSIHIVRIEP